MLWFVGITGSWFSQVVTCHELLHQTRIIPGIVPALKPIYKNSIISSTSNVTASQHDSPVRTTRASALLVTYSHSTRKRSRVDKWLTLRHCSTDRTSPRVVTQYIKRHWCRDDCARHSQAGFHHCDDPDTRKIKRKGTESVCKAMGKKIKLLIAG